MPAIYALGLLDWLIGPGLKQGNVYDNPLPKMNEWMNEWMNAWVNEWMNEWMNFFKLKRLERSPTDSFNTPVDLDITTEELMLIKFIHAKFYVNAIAIYNASKMNTHEFNKLLGFEAGAHSPFHTPTGSATWYVIQFRARTAILAAESRTQRMWACPINVRSRCHQ